MTTTPTATATALPALTDEAALEFVRRVIPELERVGEYLVSKTGFGGELFSAVDDVVTVAGDVFEQDEYGQSRIPAGGLKRRRA